MKPIIILLLSSISSSIFPPPPIPLIKPVVFYIRSLARSMSSIWELVGNEHSWPYLWSTDSETWGCGPVIRIFTSLPSDSDAYKVWEALPSARTVKILFLLFNSSPLSQLPISSLFPLCMSQLVMLLVLFFCFDWQSLKGGRTWGLIFKWDQFLLIFYTVLEHSVCVRHWGWKWKSDSDSTPLELFAGETEMETNNHKVVSTMELSITGPRFLYRKIS